MTHNGGWSLDSHAAERAGLPLPLSRDGIEDWQLHALREVISYAKHHSPFYARHLEGARAESLRDIESLPFTDCRSLKEDSSDFLCVPPDEVARIATFASSSGTSGPPKRIFFTDEDLENTRDFFANGMTHIPGTRTLICMGEPGRTATPGSVAALLLEALSRIGRRGIAGGFVTEPEKTLEVIRANDADSLVGVPSQLLALARCASAQKERIILRGILLSGEYASDGLADALREIFDCPVFRHFGMAETGYGAAVECARHDGLHIRETDLLFEITELGGEKILPDGEWGEIVVTTLTRRGMPLIRFRTGDLGRILPGLCPCGSALKRLEALGRISSALELSNGLVRLHELDGAFHPLSWLSDYDAGAKHTKPTKHAPMVSLSLTLYCAGTPPEDWHRQVKEALDTITPLRDAVSSGELQVKFELSARPVSPYAGKKVLR